MAAIVDKLSPIIEKKPPRIANSSEVKFCEIPIAIILARVTISQPLKLFKSNIKSPNILYEVIFIFDNNLYYIKNLINPTIPKIKKSMPDNFCIFFSDIYLFNTFPKARAIESETTIPKIAPRIRNNL